MFSAAGDLQGMDNQLMWAKSCQGPQASSRPGPANGGPRMPYSRGPAGGPVGMGPPPNHGLGPPPTHGLGPQPRRPYQGLPAHALPHIPPHNPLLSQIAQSPLPNGAAFGDDPQALLQGVAPLGGHRRGGQSVSAPWAAAHLGGLQMGMQRVGLSPGWEDQALSGAGRYLQGRGPVRDAGNAGPSAFRSRAPTRSTSAGNLHETAMLVCLSPDQSLHHFVWHVMVALCRQGLDPAILIHDQCEIPLIHVMCNHFCSFRA